MNDYQRLFEEDRKLMCEKCLGNGTLADRTEYSNGFVLHEHYVCSECDGTGCKPIKVHWT